MKREITHNFQIGDEITFLTNAGTGMRPVAITTVTHITKTTLKTAMNRSVDFRQRGLKPRLTTDEDRQYIASRDAQIAKRDAEVREQQARRAALEAIFPEGWRVSYGHNDDGKFNVEGYGFTEDELRQIATKLRPQPPATDARFK